MSHDQNAVQSYNIKTDYCSLERVEELNYFATTVTNQNFGQEKVNIRLKQRYARYHSLLNRMPSGYLYMSINI
jgi:hypothetical protein